MTTVTNATGKAIMPGMAVAVQNDRAYTPGEGRLASGIATNGSPATGMVTVASSGMVELDDWTLATGSKKLTVGAAYFVGTYGRLVTGRTYGQAIGQAVSPTQMSLMVSPVSTTEPVSYTVVEQVAAEANSGIRIIPGWGSPVGYFGNVGDYYIDNNNGRLYGPRVSDGWGSPLGLILTDTATGTIYDVTVENGAITLIEG